MILAAALVHQRDFDVRIKINEAGELEQYVVTFDGNRRSLEEVYLDADKIKELAEYYRELHKNDIVL